MSVSSRASQANLTLSANGEALLAAQDEELRAIRALGILLESRLIDQLEYERRVATYQRHDSEPEKIGAEAGL